MRKVFSDEVSEQNRKYIIKLKLSTAESYYLLWGTNVVNQDNDYLLLNAQNQIVAFLKIKDLLKYVEQSQNILIDKLSTEKWVSSYKGRRAYTTYDLQKVLNLCMNLNSAFFIDIKDDVTEIVHFCNLFSDFAYQVNKKEFIKLYEDERLNILIDWINAKFLWNSDEDYMSKLNSKLKNLDFQSIKEIIKKMYQYLNENMIIVSYPSDK